MFLEATINKKTLASNTMNNLMSLGSDLLFRPMSFLKI